MPIPNVGNYTRYFYPDKFPNLLDIQILTEDERCNLFWPKD